MIKIPKQLKDMKFCRVRFKTKKGFEEDWTNKHYSLAEIKPYTQTENYGVLTGINGLGVLDDDTPDKKFLKLALENFGETFQVRGHLYYKIKNWNGNVVKLWKDGDSSKKENHLGELQGKGQMVVGAGSIHPSGEKYEVVNDVPIKEIDFDIFRVIFSEYIKKPKEIREYEKKTFDKSKVQYGSGSYEDVSDIPIHSVIPPEQNECLQHGAVTPPNFKVYDNYFRCFHCGSWGGVWLAIAVKHGIISCSDAQGSNSLSKSEADEVVKVAQEQYGLKKIQTTLTTPATPRGWALSINIRTMAERYGLLNCPECNNVFQFNESLGYYKCNSCKTFGGLKKFALMCIKLMENKQ